MSERVSSVPLPEDQSFSYFHTGDFDKCQTILSDILSVKPDDSKTLLNHALLKLVGQKEDERYRHLSTYQAALSHVASLQGLTTVVDASCENDPVDSPDKSPFTLTIQQLGLLYNLALSYFHQRYYLDAERLLATCLQVTPVYRSTQRDIVNSMGVRIDDQDLPTTLVLATDSLLCQRIVLLWLDVLIKLCHVERVYRMTSEWLAQLLSPSTPNSPTKSQEEDASSPTKSNTNRQLISDIKRPLMAFHLRACLLTGRLKRADSTIVQLKTDQPSNESSSIELLAATLPLLEANSAYLKCVFVKSHTGTEPFLYSLILSNDQHLSNTIERDYDLAGEKLTSLMTTSDDDSDSTSQLLRSCLANNLALLQNRQQSAGLSSRSFTRSMTYFHPVLRSLQSAEPTSDQPLPSIDLNHLSALDPDALLYNHALHLLLLSRQPRQAFRVLLHLSTLYPHNPRLWFRLAECCMQIDRPDNLSQWRLDAKKRVKVRSVGEAEARMLLLSVDTCEETGSQSETTNEELGQGPTLTFARQCLENVLLLLPTPPLVHMDKSIPLDQFAVVQSDDLVRWSNEQHIVTRPSSSPLTGTDLLHFLRATHLALAYLSTRLGQFNQALANASLLLPCLVSSSSGIDSSSLNKMGLLSAGIDNWSSEPVGQWTHSSSRLDLRSSNRRSTMLALIYLAKSAIALDSPKSALLALLVSAPSILSISPTSSSAQSTEDRLPSIGSTNEFPVSNDQVESLWYFTAAVVLAFNNRWIESLRLTDLAYQGLALSERQILPSFRNCLAAASLTTNQQGDDGHQSLPPLALPLLQIYLCYKLQRHSQVANLIRHHFANDALVNRLFSRTPSYSSSLENSTLPGHQPRSVIKGLYNQPPPPPPGIFAASQPNTVDVLTHHHSQPQLGGSLHHHQWNQSLPSRATRPNRAFFIPDESEWSPL